MTWLAIVNWDRYQNIQTDDPYYVKLHICILDDKKVQGLPPLPRLLWYQLLPLAGRYGNAIPYNVSAIAKETKLERHTVAKSLLLLMESRLVRETKTPKRGGKNSPRVTGWRRTKSMAAEHYVRDPAGTDSPPPWWKGAVA